MMFSSRAQRILLLLCLFLVTRSVMAIDKEADVSAVLFPSTKSWRQVSAAPKASPEFLRTIQKRLRTAYGSPKLVKSHVESPGCSFIERVFEPLGEWSFYQMDVDGDGKTDIVYAGSAQCQEGNVTLIWFRAGDGYVVRQSLLWPLRVLRISPNGASMSSVAGGCCGDPVDEYFLGNLENLRGNSRIRVTQDTQLPLTPLGSPRAFQHSSEMKLREAPIEKDRYDEDRSMFMNHAVFGNVLRKYLPGVSGVVLATETRNGKKWAFVVLNSNEGHLVVEAPYSVDAGWMTGVRLEAGKTP